MKAIRISKTGGPEVMHIESIELPPPARGEVRVRHAHIGVNFVDTYFRSGLYPMRCRQGSESRRRASSKRSEKRPPVWLSVIAWRIAVVHRVRTRRRTMCRRTGW